MGDQYLDGVHRQSESYANVTNMRIEDVNVNQSFVKRRLQFDQRPFTCTI